MGLSYHQVQHLCRYRYRRANKRTRASESRVLEKVHVDYLTDQETLTRWAGYTVKERTILFHRRFPDKVIAVTSLRRLYLKNGIKLKKVRQEKVMTLSAWNSFAANKLKLIQELEDVKTEGRKLIYLDEICFTKRSFLGKSWSGKHANIHVE